MAIHAAPPDDLTVVASSSAATTNSCPKKGDKLTRSLTWIRSGEKSEQWLGGRRTGHAVTASRYLAR